MKNFYNRNIFKIEFLQYICFYLTNLDVNVNHKMLNDLKFLLMNLFKKECNNFLGTNSTNLSKVKKLFMNKLANGFKYSFLSKKINFNAFHHRNQLMSDLLFL